MRLGIAEILEKASTFKKKQEKIDYLRKNDNIAIRILLKMAFDPNLKWALPSGTPPYKPCLLDDQEGMLYNEMKRMYIFHEGGHPTLKPIRREQLFIQMLESLSAKDAKLLLAVKDKHLPFKGMTKALIDEAFPGLLVY